MNTKLTPLLERLVTDDNSDDEHVLVELRAFDATTREISRQPAGEPDSFRLAQIRVKIEKATPEPVSGWHLFSYGRRVLEASRTAEQKTVQAASHLLARALGRIAEVQTVAGSARIRNSDVRTGYWGSEDFRGELEADYRQLLDPPDDDADPEAIGAQANAERGMEILTEWDGPDVADENYVTAMTQLARLTLSGSVSVETDALTIDLVDPAVQYMPRPQVRL